MVAKVLGEHTVRVQAAGVTLKTLAEVSSITGVLDIEERPDGLYVRVSAYGDLRPKIARLVVERGCELKEIGYTTNCLGEIYRDLVSGDDRLVGE